MTAFWTVSAPHERLASECMAALQGNCDPDTYLGGLVELAWIGLFDVVDLQGTGHGLTLGGAHTTAAAPVLAADSAGSISVGMPRLRKLCQQCLDCAKQYLAGYRVMCCEPHHPLHEVTELEGFETRLLTLLGAAAADHSDWQVVQAVTRGLVRQYAAEPATPAPELLSRFGVERTFAGARPDSLLAEDMDWLYLARVHHHLILNALMFALCHECSHIVLGHLNALTVDTMLQARQHEIEADAYAVHVCTTAGAIDLRAAFRIFRLMHDADPLPVGAPLTHPHSTDRLLLLGAAAQEPWRLTDAVVRSEINGLLGALQTRSVSIADTNGAAADLFLASDLDGVAIEALVREHFAEPPPMETYDRVPKLWVDAQAALIDPASCSVLTSSAVLVLMSEHQNTGMNQDDTGVTLTKRVTARVRIPPQWRLRWPHARLELRELRDFANTDSAGHFAQQSPDFTAAKMLQRHVLWDLPNDTILDGVIGDNIALPPDAPLLLDFANWCDDYERTDVALQLRVSAVQVDPAAVPSETVSALLETLTAIGRAENSGDELVWAFQTAATVAAAYLHQTGNPVQYVHGALSMQAMFEQRWLDAFDHAFAETCLYPSTGNRQDGEELIAGMCQAIRAYAHPGDDANTIVNHLEMYNSRPSWRRGRRRTLYECLALLDGIRSRRQFLSVRQCRAEVLVDLSRMGDRQAADAARQVFDSIIADFPWFTPAYAQACHLMLDRNALDEARHYLRLAEDRNVLHEQVSQARHRLLDATHHR